MKRGNKMAFRYKVKVYTDDEEGVDKIYIGILFADDFRSTIDELCDYYGEKNLEDILCLRAITDGNVVEAKANYEEVIDEIEKRFVW